MIGRLIQDQQIWFFEQQTSQEGAGLLTAAQLRQRRLPGEPIRQAWRGEGVADDLGQAGAGKRLADMVRDLERLAAVGGHRGMGQDPGDLLVAPDTGDLLGDVRLDRDVAPPRGNDRDDRLRGRGRHRQRLRLGGHRDDGDVIERRRLRLDPDATQDRPLLIDRDLVAEEAVDAVRAERDSGRRRLVGGAVHAAASDRPTRPFGDQACRPIRPDPSEPELDHASVLPT